MARSIDLRMRKRQPLLSRVRVSPVPLCVGIVATLSVVYLALIAVVMTYAALTIGFAQSVRNDEATVATLETQYFSEIAAINATDYTAAGYTKPLAEVFVPSSRVTALR